MKSILAAAFLCLALIATGCDSSQPSVQSIVNISGNTIPKEEQIPKSEIPIIPEATPKSIPTPQLTSTPKPPTLKIPTPSVESKSKCDPNYSGCVPIASDVDCAGGKGNGPAYVRGPVSVIGTDIYDLDRDGDGTACDK